MNEQTFVATNLREALQRAKAMFGADAMILNIRETRTMNGQDRFEVRAAAPEPSPSTTGNPQEVQQALAELRSLKSSWETSLRSNDNLRKQLETLVTEIRQPRAPTPEAVKDHHALRGVDLKIARTLVSRAEARSENPSAPSHLTGRDMVFEIARSIPTADTLWDRSKRTVAALIGATGVGKTTTVVKLAGQASLVHNKSVGIITLDAYRVGKVRTLESLAKSMGIEVKEATDRASLQEAARSLAGCDLILIDTPGLNPWDRAKRHDLLQILDFPDVEKHLVLSATARTEDLRDIAADFDAGQLGSLIFTKLDESRAPATMLAATWDSGHRVSHLCNGQDIPEDIHAAEGQVASMLGRVPSLPPTSEFASAMSA